MALSASSGDGDDCRDCRRAADRAGEGDAIGPDRCAGGAPVFQQSRGRLRRYDARRMLKQLIKATVYKIAPRFSAEMDDRWWLGKNGPRPARIGIYEPSRVPSGPSRYVASILR